jgi:hypothetical protein
MRYVFGRELNFNARSTDMPFCFIILDSREKELNKNRVNYISTKLVNALSRIFLTKREEVIVTV